MIYEVVPSPEAPDLWLVEAIDHDSEGEIYSALFYGSRAKERADEYAAWKSARADCAPASNSLQHG